MGLNINESRLSTMVMGLLQYLTLQMPKLKHSAPTKSRLLFKMEARVTPENMLLLCQEELEKYEPKP
jgi:hypothetical protein